MGRSRKEVESERVAELNRLARVSAPGAVVVRPTSTYDEVDDRLLAKRVEEQSLSVKSRGASDETRLHVVTAESRSLALAGAVAGIPRREVAAAIGISMETLIVHYGKAMAEARARANIDVGLAAHKGAKAGNAALIQHWTKCRMGWKERGTKAVVGVGGGGFNLAIIIDG